MDVLRTMLNGSRWPQGWNFNEDKLKSWLSESVWSEQAFQRRNGCTVSPMRPGLITDFDNQQSRISYNWRKQCYFLTSFDDEKIVKRPDFIFKTGPSEVTLVEVRVCMRGYLDEFYFHDLYTYNINKGSDLDEDEEVHSDSAPDYDFIRCSTMNPLCGRADQQAHDNASLLRYILPKSITVKYFSFVACQNQDTGHIEYVFSKVFKFRV